MRVGFWKTSNPKLLISHGKGLNEEQLQALRELKVGDRLKLWKNEEDGNYPQFSLGVFIETPEEVVK